MKPTLRDIEWVVCSKFGIKPEILRLPVRRGRPTGTNRPRQIAYFLAREFTGFSYPRLGMFFNRDHTTVLTGVRRIQGLIQTNPKVAAYVDECRAALPVQGNGDLTLAEIRELGASGESQRQDVSTRPHDPKALAKALLKKSGY